MSLDQLGNLGEFISSIAVILSLIYVAIQIRANSKETRQASVQRVLEASRDAIIEMSSREHQELFMKARNQRDSMDEIDKSRYRLLRTAQLRNLEMAFIMHAEGTLGDETFEVFVERARLLVREYPEYGEFGKFTKRFTLWLESL